MPIATTATTVAPITLTMSGSSLGALPGSATGSNGQVVIRSVAYTQQRTFDGTRLGPRTTTPVVLTKDPDLASPVLQQMYMTGDVVQGKLQFARPGTTGDISTYTVTFTGGYVVGIQLDGSVEKVSLVYQTIQWTLQGGATAQDTWPQQQLPKS